MDETALFKLTHGLYVLGAVDEDNGGRLVGSIVDGVMQVANKPLIIALSCHNRSYTKSCIEKSGRFSLSVLCQSVDPFVVANFGFQTSEKVDKWANVPYFVEDGLPYLKANLDSPAFSGTPTVPVPGLNDNSQRPITSSWFCQKIQVVDALPSSPSADIFYFSKS